MDMESELRSNVTAELNHGSGRNRRIRAHGGDELGIDMKRRVFPQLVPLTASERPGGPVRTATEIGETQSMHSVSERFLSFTGRSFPTGIRDGGCREPREPRPRSLGRKNICLDLAAVGI